MKSILIKDRGIFYALLFFLGVFDALFFLRVSPALKTTFSLPFLMIAPGWLMMMGIKMKGKNIWETLVVSVGLSLAFLMVCGLIANWLLPLAGIHQPLATLPMICVFNIVFMALFNIVTFRKRIYSLKLTLPPLRVFTAGAFLIPPLFPLLAVLGAISVTNGTTNMLTMVLLGSIAFWIVIIGFFPSTVTRHLYPYSIFFIGLALLLMTSLRGWYSTGHDIQLEYYVFQLTKQQQLWDMSVYRDAYNACLSITILPTILSDFLPIPDPYMYKIVFQCIFAVAPITVYLFLKKYVRNSIAFLSVIYFLSFPTFFNDMAMLNRQEIGFIFFFLLFYILFTDHVTRRQKRILGIIFACSLVISHYSTTYITIGIFAAISGLLFTLKIGWIRTLLWKLAPFKRWWTVNTFSDTAHLPLLITVVLIVATFIWNSQLTKTAGGLVETLQKTIVSMRTAFQQDNKSSDVGYSFFFHKTISNEEFAQTFIKETNLLTRTNTDTAYYPAPRIAGYQLQIIPPPIQPETRLGQALSNWHINILKTNQALRQLAAKSIQIFILLGLVSIVCVRTKRTYDLDYLLACVVSMGLIVLMIVLPQISLHYGLLRLFQQLLLFLSFPVVAGTLLLFRFVREKIALFLASLVAVGFFLTISGFFSEITGGYYPQLNLANDGLYYQAYYVHKAEVLSADWLGRTMGRQYPLQTDYLAANKLYGLGDVHLIRNIFPQAIEKDSYVYADTTNASGRSVISVDRSLVIAFPLEFLDANKNLIYNNGSSRIYK